MNITSNTVQTIFGGRPAKGGAPVLDPADIAGNTLIFAMRGVGETYAYLWWFFLHNTFLTFVWGGFGITGAGPALFCSLLLFVAVFTVYGLGRAFYEAETAAPHNGPAFHPPSILAALGAAAAQAPQGGGVPPSPPAQTAPAQAGGSVVRRVVGNASLSLYHRPTCVWADRIDARHRAEFDSPASARAAGYRACRVCAP